MIAALSPALSGLYVVPGHLGGARRLCSLGETELPVAFAKGPTPMTYRPLVLALLLGAACSAAACSTNLSGNGAAADGRTGDPNQGGGNPDDDGKSPDDDGNDPDADRAVDGGKTSDAGGQDAAAYASDPLNCGASGHSCLGASCTQGVCAAEKFRSGAITDWFAFSESGEVVSLVRPTSNAVQELRRGPATASATDDVVFKGTADLRMFQGEDRIYRNGALFSVIGQASLSPPNPLWKFTGTGGAAAS